MVETVDDKMISPRGGVGPRSSPWLRVFATLRGLRDLKEAQGTTWD